ncbi:hypothetical protein FB45DRAFT_367965 [Roridomyces roridus]|uniref:Uncharacterized protein n=1 Tax=Roridomyces roridus TaxID=1738132 RepID=A0AAD7B390_9AGAR|nr:hypothetical protein FB45DRAFT_367965 [Roridomyces roridus]
MEQIICISAEDGKYCAAWICVGPMWEKEGWVSPDCVLNGWGGTLASLGSIDWQAVDRYLHIHRGCLAFLCRRLSITPQILWESIYKEGTDYSKYGEDGNRLLVHLEYYEMDFTDIQDANPREDGATTADGWFDPDLMDKTGVSADLSLLTALTFRFLATHATACDVRTSA